jgi:hypothetical protein
MAILWVGGEDIDFPNGAAPVVSTTSTNFRSGWARCAVGPNSSSNLMKSTVFPGGAITSGWLRFYIQGGSGNSFEAGFGKSGTNSAIGIGFASGSGFMTIEKYQSGTRTNLATSSYPIVGVALTRFDVQLISYGVSGTINVYINGALQATFTGDLTLTGVSSLDSVFLLNSANYSEVIVSDESTLAWQGLVTFAPSGNGTTQNFSNPAFTNFNPTTINDANATFTNATGQDEQATINAGPSGTFQIQAVKVIARALATAGATASHLKIGFNNTNNSTVAEGASHALTTAFAPVEDYFATDPTSAGGTGAWGANLTGYQLELRSA